MTDNTVTGIVDQKQLEYFLKTGETPTLHKAETAYSDQAIEEIYLLFIGYSRNLLPILNRKTGELVGIVTRNDVFRSQAKMAE